MELFKLRRRHCTSVDLNQLRVELPLMRYGEEVRLALFMLNLIKEFR